MSTLWLRKFGVGIIIGFTAAWVLLACFSPTGVGPAELAPSISTPRQVQEFLKAQDHPRYDPGKIDGVPGPRTNQAWVNWYCDQIADKAFECSK